jgi:MGT family glycosyltransferase
MTLLVISPDYASHLYPLATLATAWRDAGERVVVATGVATDAIVRDFGLERVDLRLGRGSNPGVIRAEQQPRGEDDALRGFFDATRRGPVATLAFQARARRNDLLWQPTRVVRDVLRVLDEVQPDQVVVDHLAFSARIALTGARVRHADVVLGHPSALVVGDEVYGLPPAFPRGLQPAAAELEELRALCEEVRDAFTAEWNHALAATSPFAPPSSDAFRETGDTLLLNYPAELHDPARTALLPPHAFLGSAVRSEPSDEEVEAWLASGDEPVVYVSLGSFLSVRTDVLAAAAEALRGLDVRVALASGSTPAEALGPVPRSWLVRPVLPQVRLLDVAALAVSHGGNNSVTEALTAGVPLVLLPLSTDQFAGAAAVEEAGLGEVLDPNALSPTALREAADRLLDRGSPARVPLERLRADLTGTPGPVRARAALGAVPLT